jgi:hypothetical protein
MLDMPRGEGTSVDVNWGDVKRGKGKKRKMQKNREKRQR